MNPPLDDLGVLDLVAQDPDVPDNNGPAHMENIVAQHPTDLADVKDVIVDLTLARDKTLQGASLVAEALQIRARGKISATQVMALEEIVTGIIDSENPIGLYTDVPTSANLDETVQRVNQRGMDLVAEGQQSTKTLAENLIKLMNKAGAGTLELVEQSHNAYVRAVSAYTEVHGLMPLDFQRRFAKDNTLPLQDDYIQVHASNSYDDAMGCFAMTLVSKGLLVRECRTLTEILSGFQWIDINGRTFDLEKAAAGIEVNNQVNSTTDFPVGEKRMFITVVTGIGSDSAVGYMRLLAGAMLGIATYLGKLDMNAENVDANVSRDQSFVVLSAAVLGQALQQRFEQAITVLQAATKLYSELALTKADPYADPSAPPGCEGLRRALGLKLS